ncbi:PilW family protein [Psychrobacillus sp. FSL H8-0487]|uniref:PilW family protein n=1 Tax=Psychrobacillus sp. FSL H8-0487 TaxID=2921391 RepID=UPI0030FA2290
MKNLKNYLTNQKGLTLIEILAAFVITVFISLLAINILANGLDNYKKISRDTFIRDEADYLMIQLIQEIYTTKTSNVVGMVNPTVNSSDSYIEVKTHDTQTKKTGFIKNVNTNNVELVLKNQIFPISNEKILIDSSSKIELQSDGGYLIILKLVMKNKSTEFQNSVYPIQDSIRNESGG